jgi:hypothetical protein
MPVLTKRQLVENELNLISDERVREGMWEIVDILPEYFFTIQSSASGRFHPDYAQGKGGLLRHCKTAMRIGYDLIRDKALCPPGLTDIGKELILVAIFVHDGLKHGLTDEGKTRFDHPLLMQKFLLDNAGHIPSLTHDELVFMGSVIATHMGPWTVDKTTGEVVLKEPTTAAQKFVHLCDYLSSRKVIRFKFDESWNLVV